MVPQAAALHVSFKKPGEDKELDDYLQKILPYLSVYNGGWSLYGGHGSKKEKKDA